MREITAGELGKILKEHADWAGAQMEGEEQEGEKADLSNANLINVELSRTWLFEADLSSACLRGAHMVYIEAIGANLSNADLSGANLTESNLINADLNGADLREANLSGANLRNANLRKANLSGADLYKADLNDADLREANLSGADLSGADLMEASLNEADLSGADLSGADLRKADLTRVRGLAIEQISVVKTLYGAKLSLERMKQVRKKYPHLLEEIWLKGLTLRSSYKTLSVSEVQTMPSMCIREKYNYGFYGYSKINHVYYPQYKDISLDQRHVVDDTTGLMWHRSGSGLNTWCGAMEWVEDLNSEEGYAGYRDWRMPTVEEAVSLLESSKKNGELYIDPVFSDKGWWTWTGDKCEDGEGSEAAWTVNFYFGRVGRSIIGSCRNYVRPVRSVE